MQTDTERSIRNILDKLRILIVDDYQDNLDLLQALLLEDGYEEVVCELSGQAGLKALEQSDEFGLVLLDIMMPEMDGYEVLNTITTSPKLKHIPVIMVTGGALRQSEALEKSFRLGAIDYVSKPVNEIELRWRVRSALLLYCERQLVRQQTDTIRHSEEKFRALFESTMDECALMDPESLKLIAVNKALQRNSGLETGKLAETCFSDIYPANQSPTEHQKLDELRQQGFVRYESTRKRSHGNNYPVDAQITNIGYGDKQIDFLVQRDITERKRDEERMRSMSEQLSYLAAHDPLTGLPNRREFEKLLMQAISSAMMEDQQHTLCFVDLDQFKIINDTSGHGTGDEILIQIAALLKDNIRNADTVARLGGDEFGLLFQGCDIDNATRVVEQLRNALSERLLECDGRTYSVSASFGLISIETTGGTITDLMAAADSACYAAKELGRNRLHIYTEDDSVLAERKRAMEWVYDINRALVEKRFVLYCQPIISLADPADTQMRFWEILLRIVDENGDLITPGAFIVAAERYHIMPAIDQWIVPSALEVVDTFYRTRAKEGVEYRFFINLSGIAIGDDRTLELIKQELAKCELPPGMICFEITETAVIQDMDRAIRFINELKELGCRFALDDFGRGSSNFVNLRELPLDYLKIDGSFVRNTSEDALAYSIVQSINDISQTIGIQTVVEFVENDTILAIVRDIGVDFAQGYGIAKPMPITDLFK